MSIPAYMKSRPFWIFASLAGSVSGAVVYDRYQSHTIFTEYMKEAKIYGDQPLYDNQQARRIGLVLLSPDEDSLRSAREHFRNYAIQLLTAAGVDYQWILTKDPVGMTREWNSHMQQIGTPEKMLDEGKYFTTSDLNVNLLNPLLQDHYLSAVAVTESDWKTFKDTETNWSPDIDGFVALNKLTFNYLHENFREIFEKAAVEKDSMTAAPKSSSSKQSLLSFLSFKKKDSKSLDSSLRTDALLAEIPCEYSLNPFQRLYRYLFAQRVLTREIGAAALKIIRDSNRTPTKNPPNCTIQFYE